MVINAVIDLSHHNGNVDLGIAKGDGIEGVILKATQGTQFHDPEYSVYLQKAKSAGIMVGAYHFGVGQDGVHQADYFLEMVKPDASTLCVLDFEENPTGSTMTLDEARDFVTHIKELTGRWPGIYGGSLLKRLLPTGVDPVLSNCWLWVAQYGPRPTFPPTWPTWTMWQYTDGAVGNQPHIVSGVGRCDRNYFNGTEEALRKLWGY